MSCAIYALRFRSRQFYVGSSIKPNNRFQDHRKSCLGNKPDNSYLSRVWKKFGDPKLIILMEVPKDKLQAWEQLFLDILFQGHNKPVDKSCLNLNPYADRGPSRKGSVAWNRGKPTSEEVKAKLRGRIRSEETRKLMSEKAKGRKQSEETKAKQSLVSPKKRSVIAVRGEERIVFAGVREAAKFIGRDHKGIVRAIKGDGQRTCAGYSWTYADETP